MQNRGAIETPTKSSSHRPPLSSSSSLSLSSASELPRTPTTTLISPPFLRSSQTVLTAGGTPVRINSQPHLRSRYQEQQQQRQQIGVQATTRGLAVYDGNLTPRKVQPAPSIESATSNSSTSPSVRPLAASRDLFSPLQKMDTSTRGSSRLARRSEAALPSSSSASTSHPTSSTPRRQTMISSASTSSPPPPMPGPSGLRKPLGIAAKSRRSEVHAQEVDQLRAQSRAGFSSRGPAGLDDDDDDSDADFEDHRRILAARNDRNARRGTSPFSGPGARHSSSGHDTSETEATQRPLRRTHAAAATSPRYSTVAHLPSASTRRQPLPDEFFPPHASSSSSRTRQESEETILNRPSDVGDAADHRAATISSRAPRRRRYASDAHADEIPSFQYEGRGGTGAARLSVDASSAKRHLAAAARARTTSGPQAAAAAAATSTSNTLSPRLAMREFAESSSPVPRARGMSVASSSATRPASRMSATGAATVDLFDDNSMRSPTLRARPDLPPEALDRVRALRLRQEALQAVPLSSRKDGGGTSSGASAGIDDVRARIEDIDIRGSAIASSSRSSSVISSAPRPRAHTAQLDRQRLLAEQQRGPAPFSEPRRLADGRRAGAGGSEEPLRANGHAAMQERLRRHASHAAFPSTPDVLHQQRPASRFSTLSRGVTPGPVLKSTSSAASRGAATTAHERNLLVAFDLFERNFGSGGTENANHTSPTAARLYGPESGELVEKARGFLDTVTTLNAGLRDVAQYVIQREIDAEVDASLDVPPGSSASASASSSSRATPLSTLALLKELDQGVGSLVKYSDNQVRNLGELLAAFTRADRERTRMRTAMGGGGGDYDRSDSRMSHTGTPTNWSPTRHGSARRGNTLGSAGANLSLDNGSVSDRSLRRAGSLAPSSGLRRETRDIRQAATTASSSAAGSESGSIDRRSSLYRSAGGGGNGSIVGSGIAPDDPRTSPTMSIGSRPRTTMGAFAANHHHGRSYSELSPGPLAPERSPSATKQRLAFLTQRREQQLQRDQGVATLGRSATAPRRPKLSDPSLATAIAVSSNTHAMSDRPIVYDGAAGALEHAYHDDNGGEMYGDDADDYFDDDDGVGPSRDSSTADGRGGETPRLGMRSSRDEMPPPPPSSRQHRAAAHMSLSSRRTVSPIATAAATQQLDDDEPYERIRSATEGPGSTSTSDASFASGAPFPSPTRPLRNPRRSMILSRSGSGSGISIEIESGERSGAGLGSSSFDVILDGYHSSGTTGQDQAQQQRPQSVAGYSPSNRRPPAQQQQQSNGPSAWRHPNGLEGVRGSSLLPHSASPTSSSSGAASMAHTLSARTSLRQSLAAAADQEGRGAPGKGA